MFATPALRDFILPDPRMAKPKSGADLMIAATAIVHAAAVATNFAAIHRQFPLPGVYKPFTDEWVVAPAGGAW
jgi:hypothetical protein